MAYINQLFGVTDFYVNASTASFEILVSVSSTQNTDSLAIKDLQENTLLTFNIGSWSGRSTQTKTITLTSAQKTTLQNAMGNVATFQVQYVLTSSINGSVIGSSFTYGNIYKSSANDPVISSITYEDTNADTIAVTGDNQLLVTDRSTLTFHVTATTQSSVFRYAVKEYGGREDWYSSSTGGTLSWGRFWTTGMGTSGGQKFTISVTDSNSRTTFKDIFVSYADYRGFPTLTTYSVKRNASDNTKIDLAFSGRYYAFGTNTVTAKYKYRVAGTGSYSAESALTLTVDSSTGTFSCSATGIGTFAEDNTYDFVIILADKLETNTINLTIPSVVPLVTFRPNALGVGGEPTHTNALDVASGYSLNANGVHNTSKVLPYSFVTTGGSATAGWARIARLVVNYYVADANIRPCIEFTVQQSTLGTGKIKIMFNSTSLISTTIEPSPNSWLGGVTNTNGTVFSKRVSTDPYTYDIYFPKGSASDVLTVYTECSTQLQDWLTITYEDDLITTLPADGNGIRYFAIAPLQVVPINGRLGLGWNGMSTDTQPASKTLTVASDWSIVNNGTYEAASSKYYSQDAYAINMNNSDIIRANGIYMADSANAKDEGVIFKRNDNGHWDTLYAYDGEVYIRRDWEASSSAPTGIRLLTTDDIRVYTYDGNATGITNFWNSAITTRTSALLRRSGRTTMCYLRFAAPSTAQSGQAIATIPTGYRPTIAIATSAIEAWIKNANAPVTITSSGAVAFVNTAFTTSATYIICATWITGDAYPS